MNKKSLMIIVGILSFVLIIAGISYSYFVYNKDIGNVSLNTGDISIDFSDSNGNKTLTNVIPLSDIDGKTTSDYFDFTVNATVDTEKIYYEVYLLPDENNTLDTSFLKTYLTDQNNVEIKGVRYYDSLSEGEVEDGKVIYKGLIELDSNYATRNESKAFRLRMWLDENYSEQTSKTFDFDIYLYAKNVAEDYVIPDGEYQLRSAIAAKEAQGGSCSNITYEEDGITYLSGTNTCVDMNYVWYSGKLWRITAIYPDGAMKLVTSELITTLSYNSNTSGFYTDASNTSVLYQWLNEDFYDTLYHANDFIDISKKWNLTSPSDGNINTKPSDETLISSSVGLLTSYEYYNSYRNLGNYYYNYLSMNSSFEWWLLNAYDSTTIWVVVSGGYGSHYYPTNSMGVRPSIVIKSGIEFTGNGTISSPFKIVGDKETGQTNELVNTRLSGEYIKLKNGSNEQLFRIIGVEDNKTKIIAMDYAENKNTRKFATNDNDAIWGSGSTTDTDTWYTYLNAPTTGYLATLKSTYGELFDSGIYYYGVVPFGQSYKLGICTTATTNIKNCTKINLSDSFDIGLPRYGEMFATLTPSNNSGINYVFLISRSEADGIWVVTSHGSGSNTMTTSPSCVRPTFHLKSTVKILSGTGTETDPYVVGL